MLNATAAVIKRNAVVLIHAYSIVTYLCGWIIATAQWNISLYDHAANAYVNHLIETVFPLFRIDLSNRQC